MRSFLVLCFCMMHTVFSQAQFTVSGTVENEAGEKLESALVYIMGTDYATTTDAFGYYKMEEVKAGYYKLKSSFLGYENVTEEFEIESDVAWNVIMIGIIFDLDQIEIKSTWADHEQPITYRNYKKADFQHLNNGQDVPYVLKYTPSVVVNSDAGNGVGYTGIRVRGSDPSRTNVTINGIPLNDAESQLVFWVDLPDILGSTSEIQIQRGVGTSTVGTSAFGSNINLNTQAYHLKPYADISSSIGSFNTNKLGAAFGTGLMNSKVSIDGRYSFVNSDGYVDRASSNLRSYMISAQYFTPRSALRAHLFSGNEITYQAWNGLPAQFLKSDRTYNISGTEKAGTPYQNEVDNYTQTHFQLHYDYELSKSLVLNLAGHYTRGSGYYENYLADRDLKEFNLSSTETDDYDVSIRRWLQNHFYGTTYSLQFENASKSSKIQFTGAVNQYQGDHFGEAIWNERDYVSIDSVDFTTPTTYYENEAVKNEINHFIKWDYKVNAKIRTYIDLQHRYVHYAISGALKDQRTFDLDENYSFFNPKAGLSFLINSTNMLYSSVALAHREPNRNDFTDSGSDGIVSPERLVDVEFGYKYNQGNTRVNMNFYLMKYDNQLVLTGKINDVGEYTRENVKKSFRQGVELNVGKLLLGSLYWDFSLNLSRNKILDYTYYRDLWTVEGGQDSLFFDETTLAFSPSSIISNALTYTIYNSDRFDQKLNLIARSKYVGKQYIDNSQSDFAKLDAYLTNDLSIEFGITPKYTKRMSVQFSILNLLNEKYISNAWTYRFISPDYNPTADDPYTSEEGNGAYNSTGYYPQAGRHFMLSLNIQL